MERHNRTLKTLSSRNTTLPAFIAAVIKHDKMKHLQLRQNICRLQLTTKIAYCNAVSEDIAAQLTEVSSRITSKAFDLLKGEVDTMSTHADSVHLTAIGLTYTDSRGVTEKFVRSLTSNGP